MHGVLQCGVDSSSTSIIQKITDTERYTSPRFAEDLLGTTDGQFPHLLQDSLNLASCVVCGQLQPPQ